MQALAAQGGAGGASQGGLCCGGTWHVCMCQCMYSACLTSCVHVDGLSSRAWLLAAECPTTVLCVTRGAVCLPRNVCKACAAGQDALARVQTAQGCTARLLLVL